MLSKSEVKYIQSLCHKSQRNEAKAFVAEGPKLVLDLLQSGVEIERCYATKAWIETNPAVDVATTEISELELQRISQLQTPNQVLVIAKQMVVPGAPVFTSAITLALDGIQDPGNMGTLIRIADWFGIQQLICSPGCADIYNPKVVQATMGSIARVHHWEQPLENWLLHAAVPVYGALLKGESLYNSKPLTEGILVIGNEARGISEHLLPFINYPITIPRIGLAESLNAAVAAGIILSHLVPQP